MTELVRREVTIFLESEAAYVIKMYRGQGVGTWKRKLKSLVMVLQENGDFRIRTSLVMRNVALTQSL